MPRVRKGAARRRKHKRVLKSVRGHRGAEGDRYQLAVTAILRAGQYAYRDRKARKRDFRGLWIARISAACRQRDQRYSQFIAGLKKAPKTKPEDDPDFYYGFSEGMGWLALTVLYAGVGYLVLAGIHQHDPFMMLFLDHCIPFFGDAEFIHVLCLVFGYVIYGGIGVVGSLYALRTLAAGHRMNV